MRRTMIVPAALLLFALALTGCSAGGASDAGAPEAIPADQSGFTEAKLSDGESQTVEDFSSRSSEQLASAFDTDRQVITTGYVTITVTKPMDAAAEAIRITESVGGRIDGRSEYAPVEGKEGSATLTLRIPSDALTSTLDKFDKLGVTQEVSFNSADVTMETQDLGARIKALSASVNRLLLLLETATDTDVLIKLETAISDRQSQLESLESQQRYYADQVSLSTVTLNLVSNYEGPIAPPDNFFSGLIAGWSAFVAFFSALLVGVGVLVPWLVLAGILALAAFLLVKRSRRRAALRPAVGGSAVVASTAVASAE